MSCQGLEARATLGLPSLPSPFGRVPPPPRPSFGLSFRPLREFFLRPFSVPKMAVMSVHVAIPANTMLKLNLMAVTRDETTRNLMSARSGLARGVVVSVAVVGHDQKGSFKSGLVFA